MLPYYHISLERTHFVTSESESPCFVRSGPQTDTISCKVEKASYGRFESDMSCTVILVLEFTIFSYDNLMSALKTFNKF